MPRKKKEETASSKPVRKAPVGKPVKKASKTAPSIKKVTIKKTSAQAKVKSPPSGKVKKASAISKGVKTTQMASSKAESIVNSSFKSLPRHGETQLVAFVRDPHCVFTYWEVTPDRLEEVKKELKEEFKDSYMVLRLLTAGVDGEWILSDEIRIEPGQINRYVDLKQTGGNYVLEIAQKTGSGRYVTYARSNPVLTAAEPYVSASLDVQDPVSAGEVSQEMLNYFYEQGYDPDSPPMTEFISSAENQRRLQRKRDHYKASFF